MKYVSFHLLRPIYILSTFEINKTDYLLPTSWPTRSTITSHSISPGLSNSYLHLWKEDVSDE